MSLDPSELRVSLEEHERWRRTLHIALPAETVQREQGAIARVVDEAYRVALEVLGLDPINEGEIDGVCYEPGSELSFRVSFDVAPVIEITRLDDFGVELPRPTVAPEDVEGVIARLLAENAIWRPAEDDSSPRDGDLVTIELERLDGQPSGALQRDSAPRSGPLPMQELGLPWLRRLRLRADTRLGKRFQLVLGEGDAVPDLEQAIRALKPGETRELLVRAGASGPDAAPPLHLRLTLLDRRMRELPELDDAFARSLGPFESVEALRREVRSGLEREARNDAAKLRATTLLDAVQDANPFDAPRSLVDRHLDEALGDTSGADPHAVEQARHELEGEAEAAVKRRLLVERIAALEGLGATPEEVEARVAEIARIGGVQPEQVRARLVKANKLHALIQDITESKVVAFLEARSVVVEKT